MCSCLCANGVHWSLNRCNQSRGIDVLFFHFARVICSQNKCTHTHMKYMVSLSLYLCIYLYRFFTYIQKPSEWRNVSGKIVPNMHLLFSVASFADYLERKKKNAHTFTFSFSIYIYNTKHSKDLLLGCYCWRWCFHNWPNCHHSQSTCTHAKIRHAQSLRYHERFVRKRTIGTTTPTFKW